MSPDSPARAAEASHQPPEPSPPWRPRIYVASLSDYNAGRLHGGWLEVEDDLEALQAGIDRMLRVSPTAQRYGEPAEEWAIHDFDGWGGIRISEYERLEHVVALAQGLHRHGHPFAAWADLLNDPDSTDLSQFEDHFIGEFDSLEDFAEQQIEDLGFDLDSVSGLPESLRPYIRFDLAAWARDLKAEGLVSVRSGQQGVYMFWNLG